jgi:NDP-sugar pyrophosphorylase family protein
MKYCILAAGIGSRNNSISGLHKGLLPIQNIPMISHIINKFDRKKEIIITVGHLAEQIKSYLKFVHSDKRIKFIEIDKFSGKGSGPGYSLLQCKKELQCPFVFAPIDTFLDKDVKLTVNNNWIGTVNIPKKESEKYCLINGKEKLESIYYGHGELAYNGIAGIYDYSDFWKELENSNLINNEYEVTSGFKGLENVELKYFENFYDTGTKESYLKVKKKFSKEIVFPKNNETIFIENNKVIKYFSNEMKCNNRIKRIEHLEKIPSKIKKLNSNMFGYEYIEGDLLSNITDTKIFSNFLEQFYEFTHTNNICDNLNEFRNNCTDMYKIKTYERIKKFKDKEWDKIDYINGVPIKPIINILNEINWEEIISNAIPANFHGDLQPENIIITKDKKIVLIDWRESFGSDLKIGDFYYDLSKLYHGLIINGTIAKEKKFLVRLKQNRAEVSYLSKNNLLEFNKILESFCKKYEIDYEKVKLLGILHYINIAEFYEETEKEYSKFIFLLGKLLMSEILSEKRDKK